MTKSPSDPHAILKHQVRIVPALQYIASFRHIGAPRVVPDAPLPISDDEVAAWVKEHEFTRSMLAPHVAKSLAFIDRWKRTPDADGGTV